MTHTKQLLLVTFCDTTAGIGASFQRDAPTAAEGQTDVEVKKLFKYLHKLSLAFRAGLFIENRDFLCVFKKHDNYIATVAA